MGILKSVKLVVFSLLLCVSQVVLAESMLAASEVDLAALEEGLPILVANDQMDLHLPLEAPMLAASDQVIPAALEMDSPSLEAPILVASDQDQVGSAPALEAAIRVASLNREPFLMIAVSDFFGELQLFGAVLLVAAADLRTSLSGVAEIIQLISFLLFFGGLIMAAMAFMIGRTENLKYGLVGAAVGALAWVIVSSFFSVSGGNLTLPI